MLAVIKAIHFSLPSSMFLSFSWLSFKTETDRQATDSRANTLNLDLCNKTLMNNLKVLLILFLCSTYTYSIGQTILAQNIEPYNFGMFTLGGQSSGVLNLTENSTLTTSQNITVLNQSTISAAKSRKTGESQRSLVSMFELL